MEVVHRDSHRCAFGDVESVELEGFFAHSVNERGGGEQPHGLGNHVVQVLQIDQVLV